MTSQVMTFVSFICEKRGHFTRRLELIRSNMNLTNRATLMFLPILSRFAVC